MLRLKLVFTLLALTSFSVQAKPSYSHSFDLHAVPDHFDFVPPVLPPAHFHTAEPAPYFPVPAPLLPAPTPLLHAPAPLLPAPAPWLPAPAHLLPAPAPLLPAPAPLLPAPAPLLPAPAPVFQAPLVTAPAPVFHAPLIPAPAPILHTTATVLPAPEPLWPVEAPLVHSHVVSAAAPVIPAPLPLAKVLPPVYEAVPFAVPSYRATLGPKKTTHHISVGYAFPQPAVAKIVAPHTHLIAKHHHHTLF